MACQVQLSRWVSATHVRAFLIQLAAGALQGTADGGSGAWVPSTLKEVWVSKLLTLVSLSLPPHFQVGGTR